MEVYERREGRKERESVCVWGGGGGGGEGEPGEGEKREQIHVGEQHYTSWLDPFNTLYSGRLVTPGHVLSLGVPTNLNILFNCSSTSLPGNSGLPPLAISINRTITTPYILLKCVRHCQNCTPANMHPADQMSIEVVYT